MVDKGLLRTDGAITKVFKLLDDFVLDLSLERLQREKMEWKWGELKRTKEKLRQPKTTQPKVLLPLHS